MRFLDWLFGEGWDGPGDNIEQEFNVDPKKFKRVPKWTHAGKKGKTVFCPKCGGATHVHNFAWDSLACSHCDAEVEKYQWLLPVEQESKYLRRKHNG